MSSELLELQSAQWSNFGSYLGSHRVDIAPGTTYVLAKVLGSVSMDSNTGGKTTLLNVITWCLYGKKTNGNGGRSVINDNATECEARLEFNTIIVIRKIVKKESLEVRFRDGSKHWKGDKDEVQRRLIEYIGVTYKLFVSTIFLDESSDTVQFLRATPSARAAILADLVDDAVYGAAARMVKDDARDAEALQGELAHAQRTAIRAIHDTTSEIDQLRSSLASQASAWAERLRSLEGRAESHRDLLNRAQLILLKKPTQDQAALNREAAVLQKRQQELEDALRDLGTLSLPGMSAGDVCPTCMRMVSAADMAECHDTIAKLREQAAGYKKEIRKVQEAMVICNERLSDLRNLKTEQAVARRDFENHRLAIARIEEEIEQGPHMATGLEEAIKRCQKRLQEAESSKVQIETELAKHLKKADDLEVLRTAFASGIRNFLFDRIRTQLEHYTQYYLSKIHGGAVEITFPTGTNTREKFDLSILVAGKERDAKDLSKGEALRISFGLLMGLRATMLANTPCRLRLLLVDDPFGSLDDTGILHFLEYFRSLTEDTESGVETLLITVPRETAAVAGSRAIRVEQKHGCSRILRGN